MKELEQLVQSLESQKRMRKNKEGCSSSSMFSKPPSDSSPSPGFGMRSSSST
uniref:Uncharacterized protein n=1 Tax=Lotus japonicus TaxID=34305 RepID=I3S3U7_LOTJA|nr:unknown [Lotus japonicus]